MSQRFDWLNRELLCLKRNIHVVLDTALPNKQQNKAAKDTAEIYFKQAEESLSAAYINQLRLEWESHPVGSPQ